MKKIIMSVLVVLMGLSSLVAQNNKSKKDAVGTWKFEAPYAPEGYKSGIIVVGREEQKYSTTMSFTGSEYKIPGEKVKALNDSILFSAYLEGQDIKVFLKIEDKAKMSGKAVYTEGEVPLTLTKSADL